MGNLEKIDTNTYTIKPIPQPDEDPSTIESKDIIVDENSVIQNLSESRMPLTSNENIYYSYLFENKSNYEVKFFLTYSPPDARDYFIVSM